MVDIDRRNHIRLWTFHGMSQEVLGINDVKKMQQVILAIICSFTAGFYFHCYIQHAQVLCGAFNLDGITTRIGIKVLSRKKEYVHEFSFLYGSEQENTLPGTS